MSDNPDRWSREITEEDRHDVGGGVFAAGSAQDIADAVIAAARSESGEESIERRAMSKLTFYENRAARNLSPERREVLERAKAIVRHSV
jgi:Protein of unknown function (DUF3175)